MKLTKEERLFNEDLQYFKKKEWLSEKGIKFANNYDKYIKLKDSLQQPTKKK